MKRMYPRNKNGLGRTCKNRLQICLNDEQNEFLNRLSKELDMSKNDIFRWLLDKEISRKCVEFIVDKDVISI